MYLPPCPSPASFSKTLQYLETIVSHPRLVILGEFNFQDICWSSLCGQSLLSNAYCEFVFRHKLFQVVNFPTQIKGNILDLVLSSSEDLVENVFSLSFLSLSSDHYFLSFPVHTTLTKFSKQSNPYFFKFKKLTLCVCPPYCRILILDFFSL